MNRCHYEAPPSADYVAPGQAEIRNKFKTQMLQCSKQQRSNDAIRQPKTPLPLEGERRGEGVWIQVLTPSPRPSPSRERELSDRLQLPFCSFEFGTLDFLSACPGATYRFHSGAISEARIRDLSRVPTFARSGPGISCFEFRI